jgi:hypothetical protein
MSLEISRETEARITVEARKHGLTVDAPQHIDSRALCDLTDSL